MSLLLAAVVRQGTIKMRMRMRKGGIVFLVYLCFLSLSRILCYFILFFFWTLLLRLLLGRRWHRMIKKNGKCLLFKCSYDINFVLIIWTLVGIRLRTNSSLRCFCIVLPFGRMPLILWNAIIWSLI